MFTIYLIDWGNEIAKKYKFSLNFILTDDSDLVGLIPTEDWSWEMQEADRWNQCQLLERSFWQLMSKFEILLRKEYEAAKLNYHEAKLRAKMRVYENKSVIGGTIVGCILRLEAIKQVEDFLIFFVLRLTRLVSLFAVELISAARKYFKD